MRIKSVWLSVLFKLAIIAFSCFGMAVQLGVGNGRCNLSMYRYFTNQSNLLVAAYFLIDVVYILLRRRDENAPLTWKPWIKGVATMGITVTWLVAHFLLGNSFTMGSSMRFAINCVHYIVPIMTLCDWLLFDEKGLIKPYAPLVWTAFPLLYFGYAMLFAHIGDGARFGRSRYPYPFIDADKLGMGQVLVNVVLLVLAFVALGYVLYGLDRALFRLNRKKRKSAAE